MCPEGDVSRGRHLLWAGGLRISGRPMGNGAAGPGTSESLAHIHIPVARARRMERAHITEGTSIDGRPRLGHVAPAHTPPAAIGDKTAPPPRPQTPRPPAP